MNVYRDGIYPVLVQYLGNPAPIRRLREEIVRAAKGTVLEIGVGSGANFRHYDSRKVLKLYALEPNPEMRRRARKELRRTDLSVEFLSLPGERIPLADHSVDCVVSTFTLCTIGPVHDALSGLLRVLRPGGTLLFLENSLAEDVRVQAWQRRWEPLLCHVFQGLRLTRDIPGLVRTAGFRIAAVKRGCLSGFPRSWSHCCWGSATTGDSAPGAPDGP